MAVKGPRRVGAGDHPHAAVFAIHFVERQPRGAGRERAEGPEIPALVPRNFVSGGAGFAEEMAAPKDDIRAYDLLDQIKQMAIEGRVKKSPVAAPVFRLVVDDMD